MKTFKQPLYEFFIKVIAFICTVGLIAAMILVPLTIVGGCIKLLLLMFGG